MKNKPMKKTLALLLSVLMILSSLVFVVPVMGINYGDVADDNVSQVTGYVNIDPVIYTHGTHATAEYSYMMNGDTISDGTYAGEFHTNVSVNGKNLSSITCVDTGASLSVSSLSVWNTETNAFSQENVLTGALGGDYGSNTMDTKDSTATLKFTFTDGTYELRTLYVKTNPVAQHVIAYDYRYNGGLFGGGDRRHAMVEALAIGSYGQELTGTQSVTNTKIEEKDHISNFGSMYAPYNKKHNCFDMGINGILQKGYESGTVNKYAGYVSYSKGTDNNTRTTVTAATAKYYLDLSSSVNSGIIANGNNSYSIKMLVGNLYNSKDENTNPTQPMNTSKDDTASKIGPTVDGGMSIVNDDTLDGWGCFNGDKGHTGFSTITFSAASAGTLSATYSANYQHVNEKSATAVVNMPFQITVVDKSALRNVFNNYVGKKLEAKNYTKASWTAYSHALSEADYYLNNYEASTENEATLKSNLETAYNNLVPRTFDFNYENLFSFSEWAKTDCRKGNNNGTVTVDEQAGTITLDGAGDFYTLYGGSSSSFYQVPVTAGVEYTLSYDVTSTGGQQAYVFFYDENGAEVNGAISNGTAVANPFIGDYNGNNITFTVPNGCTKLGVRFGISGTGKATFSNIALYSTARAEEVGLEKWTNRQYRKVFSYGDALTSTTVDYVPTREGYTFQKWYLDLGGTNYDLSEFYDTYKFDASWTLYSEWTINQYTVKFVDKDGTTVSETKYDYGTKASAIAVPETNSAMTKDATNHYTYSWPAVSDLGASDVTYNEVTTATAHSWNDGVVDPDSTCTSEGTKTYTCTVCGQTKTESVGKKSHTLTKTEAKNATCTEDGNKEYWTCSECGKYFSDANGATETTLDAVKLSALGHKMTKTEAKNATCTEDGNKEYWTCSACGKYFSDENGTTETTLDAVKLSALGHEMTKTEAKAATCETAGNNEYYTCSNCSKVFKDEAGNTETSVEAETIEALGHDFTGAIKNDGNTKNGTHSYKCVNSGCEKYGNATVHTWNEGVVNPDATCTEDGTKTYTCTADGCGATYTEVVSQKGHTEDEAKVENEVKATCEEGGSYDLVVRCKVCKEVISTEHKTTEKLNHNYTSSVTKAATCTEKGVRTFVCQNDKTHTYTEDISALGHKFGSTTEKVDATCTGAGHEAYKQCETCKLYFAEAEKTDSINGKADTSSFELEALGHNMTKTEAKNATCEAAGNNEYYTCSNCSKVFKDEAGKTETTVEAETIEALGHDMTKTEAKAATCTEDGNNEYYTCSRCSKVFKDADGNTETTVKDETIKALGHEMTKTEAKAATCEAAGNNEYYTCSRCSKVFKDADGNTATTVEDETIEALGHEFTGKINNLGNKTHNWACANGCGKYGTTEGVDKSVACDCKETARTDATCTTAGSITYTCECGYGYSDVIKALEHDYSGTPVLTRPTQKEDGTWVDGYYTYTCQNDASHTKTETSKRANYAKYDESLEKLESLLDADITDEAKNAINELINNTIAQDLIESEQETVDSETSKLEEAFDNYSESLNSYTVKFVVNGEVVSTQTIVSGLSATAPEADNYYDETNHYTFSKWDKEYTNVTSDLTVTAVFTSEKHSFTYADKTDDVHTASCSCGYSVDTAHSYNDGEVTTEAKCETVGEKTYTCSLCGGTKTEEIEALGHNTSKVEAKEATCTEDGNKEYYTCSRCDKLFEDEDAKTETTLEKVTIKAAHSWETDFTIDKAATCEEAGSKSIHCSKCDATKDVTTIDALGHNFTNETVDEKYLASEAVCDAKAKYYKSCSVCGASSKGTVDEATFETGDVLGHNFTIELEGTKTAATCKATGSVTMKCSRCDKTTTKTLEIDPNNHQGKTEIRDQKTANCHEKGYTGDKYCLDCETKIETGTETEIDKNNHVGETQVRDTVTATCCKAGYTGDTYCLGCNDKIESGHATGKDASNHESTETYVKNAKDATCTSEGYTGDTYHKCCDTLKSNGETIPMLAHTYQNKVDEKYLASEAACDAKAEYYKSCSVCGASSKGTDDEATFETGDVLGHNFTIELEGTKTAATCVSTGSIEVQCSRCDETTTKTLEIDPNNHASEETYLKNAKDATCTSEGYTGDTYHKCCDTLKSNGETIAKLPHSFTSGDDYKVVLEPTCYSTGSKAHYCTVCGQADTTSYIEIAKIAHTYTSSVTTKATCTKDGVRTYTCTASGCTDKAEGHSYTETISALGHSQTGDWIVETEPTCTKEGVKYKKCANCDEHAVEEKIPMKDHSFGEWKVTKEATCTKEGVKTRKCACGKTETESIPATNVHVSVIVPGYAATCSKTGLTDGYKCSQCGKVLVEQEVIPVDVDNHHDANGDNHCDGCGTTIDSHGSDGCICHKNNIFSKIIRYICTLLTKICRKRIACCNDMEYYGFDIGSIS